MKLPELIARAESNNNPWAMRFEPHVMKRMKPNGIVQHIKGIHGCSRATAEMIYSTSWGLYQIMGFNLYGKLGLELPIWQFLEAPEKQHKAFEQFCKAESIWRESDIPANAELFLLEFACTYNGPHLPVAYANRLQDILARSNSS
jgi:hypothetical protein